MANKEANKESRFGAGLLLGAAIGALAALFLSPKSGRENREMVQKKLRELQKFIEEKEIDEEAKKIFGEVTARSRSLYAALKSETKARVEELRSAIEAVDTDRFKKQVSSIIARLREEGGAAELVEKAQAFLMSYIKTDGGKAKDKTAKTDKQSSEDSAAPAGSGGKNEA